MSGGLYEIWLSETHYYGGRAGSFTRRWNAHRRALERGCHQNRHMQAVFSREGKFEPRIVRVIFDPAEREAAEQDWLDQHFGSPGCVNLSNSAHNPVEGHPRSGDTRQKISKALRGVPHDEARKAQNSRSQRGKKLSPDRVAALVASAVAATKGQPKSEATRAKMSAAAQNRPSSPRPTLQGATLSPEVRSKMAEGQRNRRFKELSTPSSSNAERCWVSFEGHSKMVRKEDIGSFLLLGWVVGRAKPIETVLQALL